MDDMEYMCSIAPIWRSCVEFSRSAHCVRSVSHVGLCWRVSWCFFVFQPVLTLPKWISDYKMTSKPTRVWMTRFQFSSPSSDQDYGMLPTPGCFYGLRYQVSVKEDSTLWFQWLLLPKCAMFICMPCGNHGAQSTSGTRYFHLPYKLKLAAI